jgi:hypothetical protein
VRLNSVLATSLFRALLICIVAGREVLAQGGPPMITDDPGTPGNGHFEINIAATLAQWPHQQSWELPALAPEDEPLALIGYCGVQLLY